MEALLYEKLANLSVRCHVCHHHCTIAPGKRGICGVRENRDGILHTLNYNLAIASSIDPIEKKPLFEYMPGTKTYSFAAEGCNLACPWCQNASISQAPKPNKLVQGHPMSAQEHVERAMKYNCPSISYTYSEPTVFLEYALETMKLAKQNGLKNIWVSNGFMSKKTLELILPYLDAANIDFKGGKEVYKKYCKGNKKSVLKNMERMKENNVHLEVTTLLIPGLNTSESDITDIVEDLIKYLGKDFVWHVTRFFPQYKMTDRPPTDKSSLLLAKKIGHNLGIKTIYLGNI